jgi:asparagine synthetase B (glutamine-hydrolysing)
MLSSSSVAFLKRLLDSPAPSGFETAAARVWREEAAKFAKVSADVAGNSMAEVNPDGHPTVMLDGQGADEMLAGYRSYLTARLASLIVQGQWREAGRFARCPRACESCSRRAYSPHARAEA